MPPFSEEDQLFLDAIIQDFGIDGAKENRENNQKQFRSS